MLKPPELDSTGVKRKILITRLTTGYFPETGKMLHSKKTPRSLIHLVLPSILAAPVVLLPSYKIHSLTEIGGDRTNKLISFEIVGSTSCICRPATMPSPDFTVFLAT